MKHHSIANAIQFSPDDSQIITSSDDGTARIWESETGKPPGVLRHAHWVRGMAVSPNGHWIATSSLDDSVGIWIRDTANGHIHFPVTEDTAGTA